MSNEGRPPKSHGFKWATLLFEILGFGVAVAIAWIYHGQLETMQEQLKSIQEDTILNQRAWVVFTHPKPESPLMADSEYFHRLGLINIGKTLATRLSGSTTTVLVDEAHPLKFDYMWDVPLLETMPLEVLVPTESPIDSSVLKEATELPGLPRSRNRKLTKNEIDKVMTKEAFLVTYGQVSYFDVFGDQHRSSFCLVRPDGGTSFRDAKKCSQYNGVDKPR